MRKCPLGYFSGAGASVCDIAPAGTYVTGHISNVTGEDALLVSSRGIAVLPCSAGQVSEKGANYCRACGAGASSEIGSSVCEPW
jgi:hypothetical protein